MSRLACLLALLVGCAHRGPEYAGPKPRPTVSTSAYIYQVGEQAFAEGRYLDAAAMFRHALLQLPETAATDALRHQLILRIGYALLQAYGRDGDREALLEAQGMLTRYVDVHERMFGHTSTARAQRYEVFSQLTIVEQMLEQDPAAARRESETGTGTEPGAGTGTGTETGTGTGTGTGTEPGTETGTEPEAETAVASVSEPLPIGTRPTRRPRKAESDRARDEMVRVIRVRRRNVPSVDDPRTIAVLKSDFSEARAGLVLTRKDPPGKGMVHGPRPLLRARRWAQRIDKADEGAAERQRTRQLGNTVLRTARDALKRCYASAFVRSPVAVAQPVVEFTVTPRGAIDKVRVVSGRLVDGLGDVCMVEQLAALRVATEVAPGERVRLRLPLVFFYEGAVQFDQTITVPRPGAGDREDGNSFTPIDEGRAPRRSLPA